MFDLIEDESCPQWEHLSTTKTSTPDGWEIARTLSDWVFGSGLSQERREDGKVTTTLLVDGGPLGPESGDCNFLIVIGP